MSHPNFLIVIATIKSAFPQFCNAVHMRPEEMCMPAQQPWATCHVAVSEQTGMRSVCEARNLCTHWASHRHGNAGCCGCHVAEWHAMPLLIAEMSPWDDIAHGSHMVVMWFSHTQSLSFIDNWSNHYRSPHSNEDNVTYMLSQYPHVLCCLCLWYLRNLSWVCADLHACCYLLYVLS